MKVNVGPGKDRRLDVEALKLVTGEKFIFTYISSYRAIACTLMSDEIPLSRGLSICSANDQYVKNKGKNIAKGRAYQALLRKTSTLPVGTRFGLRVPSPVYKSECLI